MRVLLLSAYAARSHVQWQRNLQAMFPEWYWQVLSLPPRHFSWRIRGNPLYWAVEQRSILEENYDLLLATSMVDLATLRGLVPSLGRLPAVLYFHENQFEYPQRSSRHDLLEAQMVTLYSALAADVLLFNSAYNRDTFLGGCDRLLRKLPDFTPVATIPLLREKSRVLPVPLALRDLAAIEPVWPGLQGDYPHRPLRLVWSARFEHDKGGEGLLLLLRELERCGLDYEIAVTGQQFRDSPDVFGQIECEFSTRLVQFGYLATQSEYHAVLRGADIAISTAVHEFQGLAVLEAVACGCLPAVPDRLVYTELYPARFRYTSRPDDAMAEAREAAALTCRLASALKRGSRQAPDVMPFDCAVLKEPYRKLLSSVAG